MTILTSFIKKAIALTLALSILIDLAIPKSMYAAGAALPQEPAVSSLPQASLENLVDPFTGAFHYDIPLMEVPGPNGLSYPITLSYNSGIHAEQEASCVGLGWSIGPGKIERSLNGLPDDFNGTQIKYYNKDRGQFSVNSSGDKNSYGSTSFGPVGIGFGASFSSNTSYSTSLGFKYSSSSMIGLNISCMGVGANFSKTTYKSGNGGFSSFNIEPSVLGISFNNPNALSIFSSITQLAISRLPGIFDPSLKNFSQTNAIFGNKYGSLINKIYGSLTDVVGSPQNILSQLTRNAGYSMALPNLSNGGTSLNFPIFAYTYNMQDYRGSNKCSVNKIATQSESEVIYNSFGYLYMGNTEYDNDETYPTISKGEIMDISMDQNGGYNVLNAVGCPYPSYENNRDLIPAYFAQPDFFSVNESSLSGIFRLFHSSWGILHKNGLEDKNEYYYEDESRDETKQFEGYTMIKNDSYNPYGYFGDYNNFPTNKQGSAFLFLSDIASSINFSSNDDPEKFVINTEYGGVGPDGYDSWECNCGETTSDYYSFGEPSNISNELSTTINRSKLINYLTLQEASKKSDNGKYYMSFTKKKENIVSYDVNTDLKDLITQYSITNENGLKYNFGLPVFTRKFYSLTLGVYDKINDQIGEEIISVNSDYLMDESPIKKGYFTQQPYVHEYLLTEILGHDYIDLTYDGPTDDDLGSWISINYDNKYGSDNQTESKTTDGAWLPFRSPYLGYYYNQNLLSNTRDDVGSFVAGEKEQYYVNSIETKTFLAEFSYDQRCSDLGAVEIGDYDTDYNEIDYAGTSLDKNTYQGTKQLNLLKQIKLFAKQNDGSQKLLKTVNFEYDYSLMQNHTRTKENETKQDGLLTLKKVWFEYQGIYPSKISPWEFEYYYKSSTDFPPSIQEKYSEISNYGNGLDQNPDYSELNSDPWGYYVMDDQSYGSRSTLNEDHVPQNPPTSFDPAAWHLKQIKLPTGGELLVQYEQNDYNYIQDKEAEVFVKLLDGYSTSLRENKYYLDLSSVGIDNNDYNTVYSYYEFLEERLEENNAGVNLNAHLDEYRWVYFKFLFELTKEREQLNSECNSCKQHDYITGFAPIYDIGFESGTENKIYIQFGSKKDSESGDISEEEECITPNSSEYIESYYNKAMFDKNPFSLCYQFVENVYGGWEQGYEPYGDFEKYENYENSNLEDYNVSNITDLILDDAIDYANDDDAAKSNSDACLCRQVTYSKSYVRLPLNSPKKGGGIRVKRVLLYDESSEFLIGNECDFTTQDSEGNTISSGVATFEPNALFEENALFNIYNPSQAYGGDYYTCNSTVEDYYTGYNIKSSSYAMSNHTPILSGLYPSPRIGYSKVTVTSINTNDIKKIFEFFTAQEYPISVQLTELDKFRNVVPWAHDGTFYNATNAYNDRQWDHLVLSQGYSVINYNMHGIIKGINETFNESSISSQKFNYYNFSDLPQYANNFSIQKNSSFPGRKEDIFLSPNISKNETYIDINLHNDAYGKILQKNIISPVTLVKSINYTPILKSITTTTNGVSSTVSNYAFDENTGLPIVTTTSSGYASNSLFDPKLYYSYSIPAAHQYLEMGPKCVNEGEDFHSTTSMPVYFSKYYDSEDEEFYLEIYPSSMGDEYDVAEALQYFYPGDFLHVYTEDEEVNDFFHVKEVRGNQIVVYESEVLSATNDDYTSSDLLVEIIASGRKNMLTQSVGTINSYGDPLSLTKESSSLTEAKQDLIADINTKLASSNKFYINLKDYTDLTFAKEEENNCEEISVSSLFTNGNAYFWLDFSADEKIGYVYRCKNYALTKDGFDVSNNWWQYCDCKEELNLNTADASYGSFDITEEGNVAYKTTGNQNIQIIDFLSSCDKDNYTAENVIAASAITLSDDWNYNEDDLHIYSGSDISSENPYETGQKGVWRLKDTYAYKSDISTGKNYEAGIFDQFYLFNWNDESANETNYWIKTGEITEYSAWSQPLAQQDILGNEHVVKYGYYNTLPYLVADNASENEVLFESFENVYKGDFEGEYYEDELDTLWHGFEVTDVSHSGKTSILLAINPDDEESQEYKNTFYASSQTCKFPLNEVDLSDNIKENGLVFHVWAKQKQRTTSTLSSTYWDLSSKFSMKLMTKAGVELGSGTFESITKVGDWELLECKIDVSTIAATSFTPKLIFDRVANSGEMNVWMDDILMKPSNTTTSCYIYDTETKRLSGILNNQHIGKYFQYDEEGRLTRTLIETENGLKALGESYYNIPKQNR